MPRFFRRETRASATRIRRLIERLTSDRAKAIAAGTAPDDLATKIMTAHDPQTGDSFTTAEMVDQVAIFFLAGHETSASALGWALYMLARSPDWQAKVAEEGRALGSDPAFSDLSKLKITRDVFREALRLYPPVPMMVREAAKATTFRKRRVPVGAQIVLSPWHLHRQNRLWDTPDAFDPSRWETPNGKECQKKAYIPFSAGRRVCTGAGFAMAEGTLLLAMICARFQVDTDATREPVPVAYLTVRARDGIWLSMTKR